MFIADAPEPAKRQKMMSLGDAQKKLPTVAPSITPKREKVKDEDEVSSPAQTTGTKSQSRRDKLESTLGKMIDTFGSKLDTLGENL